jgi:hypothetical protein
MTASADTDRSGPRRRPLPHPAYLSRLAGRAAVLWVLIRIALLALGEGALSFGATVVVVAAVAVLTWVEARHAREPLFHSLLGTSPAWPAVAGALVAIVCEMLVGFLLRIF